MTLLDQARWLTERSADAKAVVLVEPDAEHTVTYGEFFAGAAQYAYALEAAGVRPGDLVVLVLQHGFEVLYGFWGAMLLGAAPSIFPFLTPKLHRDRYFESVRALVDREAVRVVITYADLKPSLDKHLAGISTLAAILNKDDLEPGGDAAEYLARTPSAAAKADDTAFLQHSSGSTGLQKGVMLSHRSVLNQVASYSEAVRLRRDDVVVSWLPLYHDMGLIAGFIMPIVQSIPLVLLSPFHWVRDPKTLLFAIQRHGGTLCWLPNFAYNFLATRIRDDALEGLDLSSVRALVNCSEPVMAESHRLFAARFAPYGFDPKALTTSYAMAENTFAVTQGGVDEPLALDEVDRAALMEARRAVPANSDAPVAEGDITAKAPTVTMVSCGTTIHNCEIRVLDEDRNDLPERHVGEIALRSNSMLSGYFKNPEATSAAMLDGWYLTGDMGYVADDELYITGRKKDLIIVGGKNIYPQDIESLMNTIEGVHPGRVVAFGVFNEELGTEDIAVIAETRLEDPAARAATVRKMRAAVAQSTDVTARYVHVVEPMWLIKTSSGKIARTANREKFLKTLYRG